MDDLVREISDRIGTWPKEALADLLQSIAEIEIKHFGVYRLSDDERAAVRRGLQEADEGRFASDERVAALFERFRR